ncbi:hypothetical protein Lupro_04595 [Lutibacter profundi]|uniref:DUF1853 domain-containing protein n=1 Tax=Lutibacter profundi TaxID=1622118 RepID=A0A0X8G5S9_9FLAO|nr:DUF1853 family protein [Lutibacter profundi]AMC10564.1 hypothetical protein Lupro_04595 [Lutibacter profundi]
MDLNSKEIQLQYEGFLQTPLLWESENVFNLEQLKLFKKKVSVFEGNIQKKLRLGKRVERFVSNELNQYKAITILKENIQIQDGNTTIGEIDCLLKQQEQPIHLEIVYKFYLYDKTVGLTELEHWIGPNRKDSLVKKLTKLKEKQLPLLLKPQTKPTLEKLKIYVKEIKQLVYFKAQLFIPYQLKNNTFKLINNNCIKGFYIYFQELSQFSECKFHMPTKVNWLQETQTYVNWLSFEKFEQAIEVFMLSKTSPLCWMKQPNGKIYKIFIVWWR